MIVAIVSMVILFVMVLGAWIAINPPTKWVDDKLKSDDESTKP